MKIIIPIIGCRMHGKDTLVECITKSLEPSYDIIRFASPLYEALAVLIGSTPEQIKEDIRQEAEVGKETTRDMLKALAVLAKQNFGDNVLIKAVEAKIPHSSADVIFIPDTRRQTELEALKNFVKTTAEYKLLSIKITREGYKCDEYELKAGTDKIRTDIEVLNSDLTQLKELGEMIATIIQKELR